MYCQKKTATKILMIEILVDFSFLVTGDSYQTLVNRFRVRVSKVHEIVHEICVAIWDVLQPLEMAPPIEDDWKRIL